VDGKPAFTGSDADFMEMDMSTGHMPAGAPRLVRTVENGIVKHAFLTAVDGELCLCDICHAIDKKRAGWRARRAYGAMRVGRKIRVVRIRGNERSRRALLGAASLFEQVCCPRFLSARWAGSQHRSSAPTSGGNSRARPKTSSRILVPKDAVRSRRRKRRRNHAKNDSKSVHTALLHLGDPSSDDEDSGGDEADRRSSDEEELGDGFAGAADMLSQQGLHALVSKGKGRLRQLSRGAGPGWRF
jgi:hypothetical protein